jgi:hypothetical protein
MPATRAAYQQRIAGLDQARGLVGRDYAHAI